MHSNFNTDTIKIQVDHKTNNTLHMYYVSLLFSRQCLNTLQATSSLLIFWSTLTRVLYVAAAGLLLFHRDKHSIMAVCVSYNILVCFTSACWAGVSPNAREYIIKLSKWQAKIGNSVVSISLLSRGCSMSILSARPVVWIGWGSAKEMVYVDCMQFNTMTIHLCERGNG